MNYRKRSVLSFLAVISLILFMACRHEKKEKDVVKTPAQMDDHVGADLKSLLEYAADKGDKINDSTVLNYRKLEDSFYSIKGYSPVWSNKENWLRQADSLFAFIANSKEYGLFPTDYHYTALQFAERILREDTMARKNVAIWTRADLLLTDAFFTLVKHLKQGRLDYDSVTLRKDSVLPDSIFVGALNTALQNNNITETLHDLEPRHRGYDSLRAYLHGFLATAHFKTMTWLEYPYKYSAGFYQSLMHRLQESVYIDSAITTADTGVMRGAIRHYQENNKLRITGKPSQEMVDMMNNASDWEKFKRIAINLDRYKLLPDSLPMTYVWVNLPAFNLDVVDS